MSGTLFLIVNNTQSMIPEDQKKTKKKQFRNTFNSFSLTVLSSIEDFLFKEMETSSNWLCDLSYAILQWLECKENIFAKSFLFKDSNRSLLFLALF